MIKFFGREGDFGDLCSGVGGSMPINISAASDTVGRFAIGLSNGGVCLLGIPIVLALASSAITLIRSALL